MEDRRDIPNLVRFAVPRHVMNDEHINYTIAAITQLYKKRNSIPGVRQVFQSFSTLTQLVVGKNRQRKGSSYQTFFVWYGARISTGPDGRP